MNKKLFKRLNEQIEINNIKVESNELTEEVKQEIEKKVIFEDQNNEIIKNLNIKEN